MRIPIPRDWTLFPELIEGLKNVSTEEALVFVRSKTARLYIELLSQELKVPFKVGCYITLLRTRPFWSQERENELINNAKEIGNGDNLSRFKDGSLGCLPSMDEAFG